MAVTETAVGGVPVFLADDDGPARAALVFRTGTSDERLVDAGVTHVVEHLAMHALGRTPHESNAFVDAGRTVFWSAGTPEEVILFLREVCAALGALPLDRLELERRVLLTEAARRGGGAHDELLTYRFGPRTYGVRAYGEMGLRRLQPDAVADWAATRFTAGNAALWSTFPVDGLELPLPDGPRHAPLEAHTVDPVPARFAGRRALGLDTVVPRSVAVTTGWQILRHRMYDALRVEHAVVYDVAIDTERVGQDSRRLVLLTDPLPEVTYRAGQLLTRTLERVQDEGVAQEEVDRETAAALRAWAQPGTDAAMADTAAFDTLVGLPVRPADVVLAEQQSLTADDVTAALREALAAALVSVPDEVVTTLPLRPVPRWSTSWEQGQVFWPDPQLASSSAAAARRRLLVGDRGVTLSAGEREPVTVRYAECEAVLVWDDGSRRLIGADGFQIGVLPWEWHDGANAVALLDARAPSELVIPMGAGEGPPEPSTPTPAWVAPTQPAGRAWSTWVWLAVWALVSIAVASMAFTPVDLSTEPEVETYAHLGCGRPSALEVLREGPGPVTSAPPPPDARALQEACREEAVAEVVLAAAGVVSLAGCLFVVARRLTAARRSDGDAAVSARV